MLTSVYPFLDPRHITKAISSRLQGLAEDCVRFETGTAFVAARLRTAPLLDMYVPVISPLGLRLIGTVTDHPLLGARTIVTSQVWVADPDARWVRTLSRFYRLGQRGNAGSYHVMAPPMDHLDEDAWMGIPH